MGSRYEASKHRGDGVEASRTPPSRLRSSAPHDGVSNLDLQRHLKGAVAGDPEHVQQVAAGLGDGQHVAGSSARIHSDAAAARLAQAAEAHAFTIGNDIVLAADAPRPGTLAGDALLAHELAHVEQQSIGGGSPQVVTRSTAPSSSSTSISRASTP